jgi:hypothetical protein
VEVRIHAFLALTLYESDMIRTPVATHRKTVPDTTGCEEVWIGNLFVMVAKRKKPLHLLGLELQPAYSQTPHCLS